MKLRTSIIVAARPPASWPSAGATGTSPCSSRAGHTATSRRSRRAPPRRPGPRPWSSDRANRMKTNMKPPASSARWPELFQVGLRLSRSCRRWSRSRALLLLRAWRSTRAPARLDHTGSVAAVLGLAFALGLSHPGTQLSRYSSRCLTRFSRRPGAHPRGSGGWPPGRSSGKPVEGGFRRHADDLCTSRGRVPCDRLRQASRGS